MNLYQCAGDVGPIHRTMNKVVEKKNAKAKGNLVSSLASGLMETLRETRLFLWGDSVYHRGRDRPESERTSECDRVTGWICRGCYDGWWWWPIVVVLNEARWRRVDEWDKDERRRLRLRLWLRLEETV